MTRSRELTFMAAALVFVVTAVYRFNLLGGHLGGFENDEYLVISRAAAMLRGELPSRDFVDPGYPLAYVASALSLKAANGALLGHAVLTVAMLALGAALTCAVGVAASGSLLIGLLLAFVQLCLGPRLYNYPKIVLYAMAVLAWWWYVDKPTRLRLLALGALTAVAFLFRHDHGAYIALGTGIMLAVLAGPAGVSESVRRAVIYGVTVLVCLAPYVVYLQRHGGVLDHLRIGAEFSRVDRARTSLRWPRFAIDWRAPLVQVAASAPEQKPRIKIRWKQPVPSAVERGTFEHIHRLQLREALGPDGGEYVVFDESPSTLRQIAMDPRVLDTHNINWETWRLSERPTLTWWDALRRELPVLRTSIAPGVLRRENAAPFVYYLWLALPALALVGLAAVLRRWHDAGAWLEVARLAPVIVVGFVLNMWFLRGTLPVRLADVSVLMGAMGAWLVARTLGRDLWGSGVLRVIYAAALCLVVGVTVSSAAAVGALGTNLRTIANGGGPRGIVSRAGTVAAELRRPPTRTAALMADATPVMRVAHYLHACLGPGDRAFVTGYRPEVFFFADRGFAGGHVDLRAGYLSNEADQKMTIARMRAQSAPIVITETRAVFEQRYRSASPLVAAYFDEAYRVAAETDFGGEVLRVLARRDRAPRGTYAPLGLPCFR